MLAVRRMFGGLVLYVVILAMIAAFLALRLYQVLGKRTGHEQALPPRAAEEQPRPKPVVLPRTADVGTEARPLPLGPIDAAAEGGLRAIIAAEPSFDVGQFLEGAQAAYRMVLEAFWKGDEETLGWLAEDDVRAAFVDAIAQRRDAGHVLDNRLVGIEKAQILDASLEGKAARIVVRFDADVAAVTRDAEGNAISGSLTDAVATHDVWTFARTLRSSDPNWKLADTDEA